MPFVIFDVPLVVDPLQFSNLCVTAFQATAYIYGSPDRRKCSILIFDLDMIIRIFALSIVDAKPDVHLRKRLLHCA